MSIHVSYLTVKTVNKASYMCYTTCICRHESTLQVSNNLKVMSEIISSGFIYFKENSSFVLFETVVGLPSFAN